MWGESGKGAAEQEFGVGSPAASVGARPSLAWRWLLFSRSLADGRMGGVVINNKVFGALTQYFLTQVMFEDNQAALSSGLATRGEDHHAAFYEHLSKRGKGKKPVKHKTRYAWKDSQVISGVSVQLANPADVGVLQTAPGVTGVYPIQRFRAPTVSGSRASADAVKAACKEDGFAPHVMTQVDRLHKKGYYGKGITIGVLDTGIDYTHPALNTGLAAGQRCFGKPECTVIGGYDLVGDKYTGGNDPVSSCGRVYANGSYTQIGVVCQQHPDKDPFANCEGSEHGTHVSGTIGAFSEPTSFKRGSS